MTDMHPLDRLFTIIESRRSASPESSYTAKLLHKGVARCAKKLGEEAVETALAAATNDHNGTVSESADLLYHLMVVWAAAGVRPDEVYAALAAREHQSGLEEKAARPKD